MVNQNNAMKRISAVVACYCDAPSIPVMYERLRSVFQKIGADYEIIFVNDASPDNAAEILDGLAKQDEKVVVVTHTRNFGSQSAFTSGMSIATGDAVVLLDGDLQDPPELIESFYQKWQEGYKVVYGVRIKRKSSLSLRIAYKMFYRIFKALSYVSIPLDAGDFSLLDRQVVDALNSLPENNRFLRGLRSWVGFRQTGIPYTRPERAFGKSTNSALKNFGWARKAIFSFSFAPLHFITIFSFAATLVSFLLIIVQVLMRIYLPEAAPRGFATLIILILFTFGIQLMCISIIGSYLSHIYDEVKRRPPYIVESILNRPFKKSRGENQSNA